MAHKYTHDELVKQVKSPGWSLGADVTGTLEDVLKVSHERRQSGETPGPVRELETTVELDMIQIETLWRYLGLPV